MPRLPHLTIPLGLSHIGLLYTPVPVVVVLGVPVAGGLLHFGQRGTAVYLGSLHRILVGQLLAHRTVKALWLPFGSGSAHLPFPVRLTLQGGSLPEAPCEDARLQLSSPVAQLVQVGRWTDASEDWHYRRFCPAGKLLLVVDLPRLIAQALVFIAEVSGT